MVGGTRPGCVRGAFVLLVVHPGRRYSTRER
jgi:hypothetical protein